MGDRFSLDQIRIFIAAAEEGSFSAAARKLGRAQSAVSDLIRRLEEDFGVALFDRSGRSPRLTPAGIELLKDARALAKAADFLKSRAKNMASGIEPELVVVVDVYFPFKTITEAAKEFRTLFPMTPLRIYNEVLGGALQPVLEGRAAFAVVGGPLPLPADFASEYLGAVNAIMVAAPEHPLALLDGVIARAELEKHVQLVLTERSRNSAGREYSVLSPSTWRLADLFAKHAFLLNGLGWGSMPLHAVERDLAEGRLKELRIQDFPASGLIAPMSAVYRSATPPGPAGRWLVDRLKGLAA